MKQNILITKVPNYSFLDLLEDSYMKHINTFNFKMSCMSVENFSGGNSQFSDQ